MTDIIDVTTPERISVNKSDIERLYYKQCALQVLTTDLIAKLSVIEDEFHFNKQRLLAMLGE